MKKLLPGILILMAISIVAQATSLYLSRNGVYVMSSQKKSAEKQSTTVKSGKSNSSDRAAEDKTITAKVIRVNEKDKTFTITANGKELTFNANLKSKTSTKKQQEPMGLALPLVGETVEVTYTSTGGPLPATIDANSWVSRGMTGKVIRVNDKDKTFVVLVDGKEATFAGRKLKQLPRVGATIDVKPSPAKFIFPSCEECNSVCPGVCFLGPNYCRCYLEPLPTQHN